MYDTACSCQQIGERFGGADEHLVAATAAFHALEDAFYGSPLRELRSCTMQCVRVTSADAILAGKHR